VQRLWSQAPNVRAATLREGAGIAQHPEAQVYSPRLIDKGCDEPRWDISDQLGGFNEAPLVQRWPSGSP